MPHDQHEDGRHPAIPAPSCTNHDADPAAAVAALTPEDTRIAEALADGLGRLRVARPGFQARLEARLLAQLAEPPRPWWRRFAPIRRPAARRATPVGVTRFSRRSMLGVAAATAVALTAAGLSLPLVGTPEVSAGEILDKAQANAENPVLAGVKSFHLTANIWTAGGPKGAQDAPHDLVTEQWFVAPDRMRSESRAKDANGKTVVSGMLMSGTTGKQYATDGANDVFMVSVFAAPIGPKMAGEIKQGQGPAQPAASGGPTTATAGVRVEQSDQPGGEKPSVAFVVRNPDGDGKPAGAASSEGKDVVYLGENCPEPTRTGEGTVAGRPVFVIQNDFSSCAPADAPDKLRGRHVRWVDQKTYLPLKMEMYDSKGALVDRYEVTSIEYDVAIPDKTFTDLPPGTSVRDLGPMFTTGPRPAETQQRQAP
jgi:hypothetical protein